VPQPVVTPAAQPTRYGLIHVGSSAPAVREAIFALEEQGLHLDLMRIRAFPFAEEVTGFIAEHDSVFVVEQNRDAQLRSLLVLETGVDIAKLESVRYYGGFPMSAHHVISGVKAKLEKVA
jgi:2-oxoglutarate ferredoxin oxidoreductase subunit alpha